MWSFQCGFCSCRTPFINVVLECQDLEWLVELVIRFHGPRYSLLEGIVGLWCGIEEWVTESDCGADSCGV